MQTARKIREPNTDPTIAPKGVVDFASSVVVAEGGLLPVFVADDFGVRVGAVEVGVVVELGDAVDDGDDPLMHVLSSEAPTKEYEYVGQYE